MFQFINDILVQFISCFNRVDTWANFVCLVIGIIVGSDHRWISSVVSVLGMKPKRYYALLNFLHSPAYSLDKLYEKLINIAQKVLALEEIAG
ncbi:hypothetical protein FACS1894200_00820 [Spirochaetia bacterium]|nr:hypothetical protein FACS1894200_00820 [Spirochaetia bacterium]